MNWFRELVRRLAVLFRRGRFHTELEEEMRLHRELRELEQTAKGLTPEEARFTVARRFGNSLALREQSRDVCGWSWLENSLQDVRYGLRQLRHNPGFTVVAVLTLALGIGANLAIFSVVRGVLLRPLPYHEPSRLVRVYASNPSHGTVKGMFSPQDLQDFRSQAKSFESISGYWYSPGMSLYSLLSRNEATLIETACIDSKFLSTLGATPELGGGFTPQENIAGNDNVVILSDSLWRERFEADPSIIGKTLSVGGGVLVVVGVMGPEFGFPSPDVGFWVPLSRITDDAVPHRRGVRWIGVVARLKPGVTAAQASSETSLILKRLSVQYPTTNEGWNKGEAEDLQESIVGHVKPILLVLLGAVGLVLLTACANLANMAVARGTARRREFAIRSALGAGRWRMFRHSLVEGMLVAAIGGAAALAVCPWISTALTSSAAGDLPRTWEIHVDSAVVLFGALLTLLTGLLIGCIPALKLANVQMAESLRAAGARTTADSARPRSRDALVVAEISLACLLLAASGLVLKSLWKLMATDPGFEARHVLTVQLAIPLYKYPNAQAQEAYRSELIRRVAAIPGVQAVGAGKTMPLAGGGEPYRFTIHDSARGTIQVEPKAGVYIVTPGYFKALGIPLISGRAFDDRDFTDHKRVVVINQGLARAYWPHENPVGKRLDISATASLEVLGVVADIHSEGLSGRSRSAIYAPMSLMPRAKLDLFIRTKGDPLALAGTVQRAIHEFEPEQPIQEIAPLESIIQQTLAQPKFFTTVLGIFGFVALLLAATGVFAVQSYAVRQRTHEIGIRMALGAQKNDVLQMVIGQGFKLALIGAVIGIIGALGLTRFLSSQLYGVKPTDPLTFVAATLILVTVAMLACYIPARRATKVDPMIALRYE